MYLSWKTDKLKSFVLAPAAHDIGERAEGILENGGSMPVDVKLNKNYVSNSRTVINNKLCVNHCSMFKQSKLATQI